MQSLDDWYITAPAHPHANKKALHPALFVYEPQRDSTAPPAQHPCTTSTQLAFPAVESKILLSGIIADVFATV